MKLSPCRGFTAVELAVSLSLFGLVLLIAAPGVKGLLRSNQLYSSADQVAGSLRLARQKAVSEGVTRLVVWNSEAQTYWMVRDDNDNGQADTGEPKEGEFALPADVSWKSPASGAFSGNSVSFTPDGSASQTGNVLLVDGKGNTLRLTLLGPTGQVKIETLTTGDAIITKTG